ncbi:MAG: DNA translocase FtsK [Solobacterium sp.]|nr:DNA translocase FtsK [Solobacterium sp.]
MAAKKTNKKTTSRKRAEKSVSNEVKEWIWIVLLAAITVVAYMQMGLVGTYLSRLIRYLFGKFYYVITGAIVIQILITILNRNSGNTLSKNPIAIICIILAVLLLCAYTDTSKDLTGGEIVQEYLHATRSLFTDEPSIEAGGGIIGALLFSLTTALIDRTGTVLVIIVLFIIAALLLVNLEVYKQAFRTVWTYLSTRDEEDEEEDEDEEDEEDDDDIFEEDTFEPEMIEPVRELPSRKAQPKIRMIQADEATAAIPVRPIPNDEFDDTPEPLSGFQEELPYDPNSRMGILADGEPKEEDMAHGWTEEMEVISEEPEEAPQPKMSFMTVDELYDNTVVARQAVTEPQYESEEEEEVEYEEPYEEAPSYEEEEVMEMEPPVETTPTPAPEPVKPRRTNRPYHLPKTTLLDPIPPKPKDDVNEAAAAEKGELLIQALRNFDIEARLIDTHIGPSVTKFEIRPDANVKVSRILGLADDIKMQLAVRDVRIEAPIPGHNAVGVEIPNQKATPVKMKELFQTLPEADKEQPLVIVLGKDLLGNTVTCRLDKMPHLLIAGATGSGKSVCMNSIITSILMRTKPDEVKLLLVDPKKVEFTPYQRIPHLIGPVINDPSQASNALKVIVKIMDERYDAFAKAGVRNIQGFNTAVANMPATNEDGSPAPKKMPYIVVIVDEMADLMNVAGKDVESSIQRITQLARAAGIHLIIATQRPSTDVITGVIKANIPSRIAFAVSSGIDSRTILDHVGAERLLGNGDMLYMPIGVSNPTRVQGVFITDDEVKRITDYVSSEAVPMYDDSFIRLEGVNDGEGGIGGVASAGDDPLFDEVKEYVVDVQKASTSLLQRRFGIGYNRAARMIDLLEEKGVIGPAQGSKPREVYLKKDE